VDKPFAIMAANLEAARRFASIGADEELLLVSRERPIVLLKRRDGSGLAGGVAPGNDYVGVMLPYSPLHHLLFSTAREPGALVMTSGNRSDETIARGNDEALERLAGLADAFLMHDREIHVSCDDSVVRAACRSVLPIRRSRGYAPFPIRLAAPGPQTLAVGGELKATFCLSKGSYAYLGPHIGDMADIETLQAFERTVSHFRMLFRAEPERIACDLHPGYLSTRWAAETAKASGIPLVRVQHHHAHIASTMAEHGLDAAEPVIGIAFDGTGYGTDGAIWGGEVLLGGDAGFRRWAHLKYIPLPGGDASIRRPYRSALAHLWAAGLPWDGLAPFMPDCDLGVFRRQLETGLNCVPTSSMGRLLDAIASILGIRQEVTYEAQSTIEMEALCAATPPPLPEEFRFAIAPGEPRQIDPGPCLAALLGLRRSGTPVDVLAAWVHEAVAELIIEGTVEASNETGITTVALSGGVFQNVRILTAAESKLSKLGFRVLVHHKVPPNDGGIALGQLVLAQRE
jgi:hydrogenase maturation protein HypF